MIRLSRFRRARPQIFAEILKAVIEEAESGGEVKITRIQSKVYVPFDRFREYLVEMRNKGLIEESCLKVTEKGLKYVAHYKSVKEFLERFGFE